MHSTSPSPSELSEYTDLPSGHQNSPEWRAARELDAHAQDAQGRLTLGCFIFWLTEYDYLITAVPPMGDVRGNKSAMTIYTPEHLVTIQGVNLHLLAWDMKHQRVDSLRAAHPSQEGEEETEWVIHSITAHERGDE